MDVQMVRDIMLDILYFQIMNFNPIHPLTISYSSFKWLDLSAEFHTHIGTKDTPPIHPFRMNFII